MNSLDIEHIVYNDFFKDYESGPEEADNLIRTLWVIIDAETIVDVDAKKN